MGHGLDFGYTHDPSAFAECAINLRTKDIYIYNEMYEQGMLTQDIYDWLAKHEYLKSDIYADSAEKRLITELRIKGVRRIHASTKGPNSIKPGIDFLEGFHIHILPKCTHAIEEFNTYVWDKDKDGNWINKPVDKNNHFIDALRYSLEPYILPTRRKASKKAQTDFIKKLGLI